MRQTEGWRPEGICPPLSQKKFEAKREWYVFFFCVSFEPLNRPFLCLIIMNISYEISELPLYSVKVLPPRHCYFQVISQLETSCLRDVNTGWTADNHPVTHLRFDYISRERQSRDYVMEDHEAAVVSNVSNTRDSVSSGYPNIEKRVENTTRSEYFWRNSSCLDSRWNTVSNVWYIFSIETKTKE